MERSALTALIDEHFARITEINRTKGHDYAGEDDALSNFKKQAVDLGLDPKQIWGVFAGKHWSAIMTFIKEGDVKSEPIEGRIHDIILYCFLLLALIEEERLKGLVTEEEVAITREIGEARRSGVTIVEPIAHPFGNENFR